MDTPTGILICGHGSRDSDAIVEFDAFAARVGARLPDGLVERAFLEFAAPNVREGLEALKVRGARRIVCVPGILFAAGHVKNDLPWEVNDFAAANPGLDVRFARDLAVDARLIRAAAERVAEAEAAFPPRPRADAALLVVGRGTTDPDANGNVAKVGRILWEGLGFGWSQVCFSGVTTPLLRDVIPQAVRLGFGRIVMVPYFLFTGVLIKRLHGWIERARRDHPGIEIVETGYLNDHPLLVDCLLDRVREALDGDPLAETNCALCKYRVALPGRENEVGAPQTGHHHHHVHGRGWRDHDHDHDHDHDGHHGHDHHHHDR